MIQASTTSYDLKMLLPWNGSYDCAHRLTEDDVQMVNDLTQHIEPTRSAHYPKIGDRVIHVSKYGNYSGNALIGKIEKGQCSICLNPYIPFVWKTPLGIGCDVSGGPFTSAPTGKLHFVGRTDGHFKDWGHCGACANGAVVFKARVALIIPFKVSSSTSTIFVAISSDIQVQFYRQFCGQFRKSAPIQEFCRWQQQCTAEIAFTGQSQFLIIAALPV